jgi:hypothetical protein
MELQCQKGARRKETSTISLVFSRLEIEAHDGGRKEKEKEKTRERRKGREWEMAREERKNDVPHSPLQMTRTRIFSW